jgi:presenilin-like A22 family membrane protease
MVIQIVVGILIGYAIYFWIRGNESHGLKFGVSGFLLSLVALQLFYFYLSQFSAITITLLQLAILLILLAYRRWYIKDSNSSV